MSAIIEQSKQTQPQIPLELEITSRNSLLFLKNRQKTKPNEEKPIINPFTPPKPAKAFTNPASFSNKSILEYLKPKKEAQYKQLIKEEQKELKANKSELFEPNKPISIEPQLPLTIHRKSFKKQLIRPSLSTFNLKPVIEAKKEGETDIILPLMEFGIANNKEKNKEKVKKAILNFKDKQKRVERKKIEDFSPIPNSGLELEEEKIKLSKNSSNIRVSLYNSLIKIILLFRSFSHRISSLLLSKIMGVLIKILLLI